jgi:hypothetical protein
MNRGGIIPKALSMKRKRRAGKLGRKDRGHATVGIFEEGQAYPFVLDLRRLGQRDVGSWHGAADSECPLFGR